MALAFAALAFIVFIRASAPPARDPPCAESLNIKVATRAEPLMLSQMRSGAVTGLGFIVPIIFSLRHETSAREHGRQMTQTVPALRGHIENRQA